MNHKDKERLNKAQDLLIDEVEYIMDCIVTPDFVECICETGGDVTKYRVYNDGSIYCK